MIERHMAIDPLPILADGIKWLGYLPKRRIFWNIGVYNDWLSEGQGFSTYSNQFAARVGWLPIHSEADRTTLHIAVNYRLGHPLDNSVRVRSKPESTIAPFFIDSGKFPSEQATFMGYEIYYSNGPWLLGSEYTWDSFKSPEKSDPLFHGGELVASYIFTGETRPYLTVPGIYTFVPVNRPVFKGGPGAIEGVLRYSTLDLTDGPVHGGQFWRITPQVNWYLSQNFRLELVYGYGVLNRFNLKGSTQFFQARFQFLIM
jgi:phosphate-selective porin OprO/OprP